MAIEPILSSHDEPIVVDNKPIRIDMGRKGTSHSPKEDPATGVWRRDFTKPFYLVIVGLKGNEVRPALHKLEPSAPLLIQLSDDPTDVVTFTPYSNHIEVNPRGKAGSTRRFELENHANRFRLVKKGGAMASVQLIKGTEAGGRVFQEPETGTFDNDKLLVVLTTTA